MLLFPATTLFCASKYRPSANVFFPRFFLFSSSKINNSARSAGSRPERQRDLHASRWPGRVAMWYGVGDVLVVVWWWW